MKRYLLLSVFLLALPVRAHAFNVVFDSLTGYVPANTPGARPSWLNGNVEQGIRISRTHMDQPLVAAEFFFRNNLLGTYNTTATLRFYADQNGFPADLLATVVDSMTVSARGVEQVSIDLPNLLLPEDPIWVTWYFGPSGTAGGVTLGSTTSIGTDYATRAYRSRTDNSWIRDTPFRPHGGIPPLRLLAIPEPSGILLCTSMIGLWVVSQRRHSLTRN